MQINDYLKRMRGEEAEKIDPWVRFYQIFSAKLVLEVFGGAGAIWYVFAINQSSSYAPLAVEAR